MRSCVRALMYSCVCALCVFVPLFLHIRALSNFPNYTMHVHTRSLSISLSLSLSRAHALSLSHSLSLSLARPLSLLSLSLALALVSPSLSLFSLILSLSDRQTHIYEHVCLHILWHRHTCICMFTKCFHSHMCTNPHAFEPYFISHKSASTSACVRVLIYKYNCTQIHSFRMHVFIETQPASQLWRLHWEADSSLKCRLHLIQMQMHSLNEFVTYRCRLLMQTYWCRLIQSMSSWHIDDGLSSWYMSDWLSSWHVDDSSTQWVSHWDAEGSLRSRLHLICQCVSSQLPHVLGSQFVTYTWLIDFVKHKWPIEFVTCINYLAS